MRSKNKLKSSGLSGQPYFKPNRIGIEANKRAISSDRTAEISQYNRRIALSSGVGSCRVLENTSHNFSREIESYALCKSIKSTNKGLPIVQAL